MKDIQMNLKESAKSNRFEKIIYKYSNIFAFFKIAGLWILLSIFFLIPIELISYLVLLKNNSDNEWHYNVTPDINAKKYIQQTDSIPTEYFPYLGYRRKGAFKGKYVNIDEKSIRITSNPCRDESEIRIFMMGGSTIWGTGSRDSFTIPSQLSKYLCNENISAEVINYGESGYTNTQEMIKFMLELREGNIPDILIFYDGVNEVFSAFQNKTAGYPQNLSHRRTEYGLRNEFNIIKPLLSKTNTGKILQKISDRIKLNNDNIDSLEYIEKEIADIYIENIELIQTWADRYDITVFFFWQPTVFTKKKLTKSEMSIIARENKDLKKLFQNTYDYVRLYEGLPANFTNLDSCLNNTSEGLYIDFCHVTEKGNRFIAEEMLKIILPKLKETKVLK